ncbi:MAG: hypothetical protein KGH64_02610 [Candidatus Micrarchaeota archaeon]|nr:hypothetical protein [Candidatus Micrarchaeota archaeon]MDE1834204.1 hypothetical protein [Candidatus Micrarchaeota archaeon]MDE1859925.1 hypothetical protein [Candidatus Micrarchaeota archaeon]
MPNQLVPEQYYKIVNSCPVCNNPKLYYYYDTVVENIDVICPACKKFLIVINEDEGSKNIHLHIYKTQSIVKGIMHAHQTEFRDW